MKTWVLDSWPILEWMKGGEPTSGLVDSLLGDAEAERARLHMSAINVGEVYYFLTKTHDSASAEKWRELSSTLPIKMDVPSFADIWRAASLKGRFAISYADAFAAALAMKYECPVITGDPEFRCVKGLKVDWIGYR